MPQNPKAIIKVDCPHRVNSPTPYVPPPVSTHAVERSKNCKLEMEIEMSKERVEWKWGGRETKRNDKMQLPQKVLCGNIYRTNNAPKWTSGKAESCELRAATGQYYIWQNLNWIGLDWNCTWHFIGQSAIRFSSLALVEDRRRLW